MGAGKGRGSLHNIHDQLDPDGITLEEYRRLRAQGEAPDDNKTCEPTRPANIQGERR